MTNVMTKSPAELLKQKDLFDSYNRQSPCPLSAFSFVQVFLWQDFFDFEFKVIDDHLCVLARHDVGSFFYLPPLGTGLGSCLVEQCFQELRQTNSKKKVARIENVPLNQLSLFSSEKYEVYRKGYEYLYHKQSLIDLEGNPYKSKRSDYNHFAKNYNHRFEIFNSSMKAECLELFDQWAQGRRKKHADEIYQHMLNENRQVHELAMTHAKELDLVGRVVTIDGEIKGYTFGYALNKDIFCVLFEVADLDCKGLPVFMFREFCKDEVCQKFTLINAMDDFEMENVAQAKLSFRPAAFSPMYTISEK